MPFRVRSTRAFRFAAVLLLLIGVPWQATIALHLEEADDQACWPELGVHEASAHRIKAAADRSPRTTDHCYICHWLGSFRPPQAIRRIEYSASCTGSPSAFLDLRESCLRFAELPARSPPA